MYPTNYSRLPLQAVRNFLERATPRLGLRVYAFSVFHVFFEQYLSLGALAVGLLGGAIGLSALALLALTSSPGAAGLLLAPLASTLLDLLGAMKLWQASPCPVSLTDDADAVEDDSDYHNKGESDDMNGDADGNDIIRDDGDADSDESNDNVNYGKTYVDSVGGHDDDGAAQCSGMQTSALLNICNKTDIGLQAASMLTSAHP